MNSYLHSIRERLKEIEEDLVAAGEAMCSEDDEDFNGPAAEVAIANLVGHANRALSMLSTLAASKVYKIGATYLQQDAVMDEDISRESEAIAEIGRVAAGDHYAAHAPNPIGFGQGYSHPACPRILSCVPIRHIYRLGPQGMFNGCLHQSNEGPLLSCRTQGFPSRTSLYRPDVDLLFADPKEVLLPPSFKFCSVEDMRIFGHNGCTLASFTVAGQTDKGWQGQLVLAEIAEDLSLKWIHQIPSPKGLILEKNWSFFSCDDKLFTVYYPAPHEVYEIEFVDSKPQTTSCWEATNWKTAGFMENARGGAPPVRVGDEFYHFYHTQHRAGRGTAYQTSLYTFEACPPWNIKRIIKGPLLNLVPSKRPCDVIFVMGANRNGDRWTLSCGLMDQETVGISLDFSDVERCLETVPR